MDCSDVPLFFGAAYAGEIQRRQVRLKGHEGRKHASTMSVTFSKRMDQDQFRMHDSQGFLLLLDHIRVAWRVLAQRPSRELLHESRNFRRSGEWKSGLGDVDVAVLTGPRIDFTEPYLVDVANVVRRELIVLAHLVDQPFGRS